MCGSFAAVNVTETGRIELKTQTEKITMILSNCDLV